MSKKKKSQPPKAKAKSSPKKSVASKKENSVLQKIEKPIELKNEAEVLTAKSKPFPGRDGTKYEFNGATYGKSRLVLAICQSYAIKHPKATLNDFQKVFPQELQKYYGVMIPLNEAKKKSEHYPRYFIKDKEPVKLSDGSYATTTQWDSKNVKPFIEAARKAGFTIKETK